MFRIAVLLVFSIHNLLAFGIAPRKAKLAQKVIIEGTYSNQILDWNIGLSILVEDPSKDSVLGDFYTDTGSYILYLPYRSKYKFFLTPDGSQITHYADIVIPKSRRKYLYLRQKMSFRKDEFGDSYFHIANHFQRKDSKAVRKRMEQLHPEFTLK